MQKQVLIDSPFHPSNIQSLVLQVQGVINVLLENQGLTDTCEGETEARTSLIFTLLLLRNTLENAVYRLDKLDMLLAEK